MRKITPLKELVEWATNQQFASFQVLYIQDPEGTQEYVSSITLSEEDMEYLEDRVHFMYLQDIPMSEWDTQDFLDFSVITWHLSELATGQSIIDNVNEYIESGEYLE